MGAYSEGFFIMPIFLLSTIEPIQGLLKTFRVGCWMSIPIFLTFPFVNWLTPTVGGFPAWLVTLVTTFCAYLIHSFLFSLDVGGIVTCVCCTTLVRATCLQCCDDAHCEYCAHLQNGRSQWLGYVIVKRIEEQMHDTSLQDKA
jgi:hypothetical protein